MAVRAFSWLRALTLAATVVAGPMALGAQSDPTAVDVPKIAYTRFVLPNGLTVLLHEDRSAPIVVINLGYHVGSKDEPVGLRGLAHFFEHGMFQGSAHVEPQDHMRTLEAAGGTANAVTREDRTVYYDRVPSHMFETALWLEAERMAFLPARLDSQRFELQRQEVFNEYGFTYESKAAVPIGLSLLAFVGALFPDPHPYHVSMIGLMPELKAATLADERAFFAKYYVPNNATLVAVGDFETGAARRLIEKYFGGIPRGAPISHPMADNKPLAAETRIAVEDHIAPTRQLIIGWRGAWAKNPDRVALQALVDILANGPGSRIGRALAGRRAGSTCLSGSFDFEEVGIFQVCANPTGAVPLGDLEDVIDGAVASVRDNGVTPDELRRWAAKFAVTSLIGRGTDSLKAELLEDGEMMYGDPLAELDDIRRARAVTVADVQRVARQYLGPGRVVMSVVPAGKLDLVSKPSLPFVNATPVWKR